MGSVKVIVENTSIGHFPMFAVRMEGIPEPHDALIFKLEDGEFYGKALIEKYKPVYGEIEYVRKTVGWKLNDH